MSNDTQDDAPTRDRVVSTLLHSGPTTAVDLAERLDLTPAAVRRHLDHLAAEGVVEAREQRMRGPRGRGRPAKVFAISDEGHATFGHAYDELATEALAFLRDTAGDEAVKEFADRRVAEVEAKYAQLLDSVEEAARVEVLADALTTDGYAASVSTSPVGQQMCQHHCPVAHVAEEFPQLCEAEAEMFGRLLGSHVQRLATIAHGDGVCTTHVPHNPTEERHS